MDTDNKDLDWRQKWYSDLLLELCQRMVGKTPTEKPLEEGQELTPQMAFDKFVVSGIHGDSFKEAYKDCPGLKDVKYK